MVQHYWIARKVYLIYGMNLIMVWWTVKYSCFSPLEHKINKKKWDQYYYLFIFHKIKFDYGFPCLNFPGSLLQLYTPKFKFPVPVYLSQKLKIKVNNNKKDKRWQNKTNGNKMTLKNMWIIVCVGQQLLLGACSGVWLIYPVTLSGQSCFPYPNSDQLQIACSSGGGDFSPYL